MSMEYGFGCESWKAISFYCEVKAETRCRLLQATVAKRILRNKSFSKEFIKILSQVLEHSKSDKFFCLEKGLLHSIEIEALIDIKTMTK